MRYNTLGKTGLLVSALGLGGHEYRWAAIAGHLQESRFTAYNPERMQVLEAALEAGVNYFDTTFFEEVQSLGHHLRLLGARERVVVNGMIIDVAKRCRGLNQAQMEAFIRGEVDARLELLHSDHFDIFMLCNLDRDYEQGLAQEMLAIYQKLRDEGKFRFYGASCHSSETLDRFLAWNPPVDVVMLRYNYALAHNWNHQSALMPRVLQTMRERNIGMVAMKPLCWFHYGVPFTAYDDPTRDTQAAIRNAFAWQVKRGEMQTTVVGVETVEELRNNLAGAYEEPDEARLAPILENQCRLDWLVANAPRHSDEVRQRIVTAARELTGKECGDDLAEYERQWREARA
jgi:aryl-alcohol dehydrogenase-like predicted oxidoreductase